MPESNGRSARTSDCGLSLVRNPPHKNWLGLTVEAVPNGDGVPGRWLIQLLIPIAARFRSVGTVELGGRVMTRRGING